MQRQPPEELQLAVDLCDGCAKKLDSVIREHRCVQKLRACAALAREEKKASQAKVTGKRQQHTRDSRVSVETVESMGTTLLFVGTSSRPIFKAKARAQGNRNPK